MPDGRLQVTDSQGRRMVRARPPGVHHRAPHDRRSAARQRRRLARARRDRPRRHRSLPAARSRLALRHVRQRRADLRAAAAARRHHPAGTQRQRRDSCSWPTTTPRRCCAPTSTDASDLAQMAAILNGLRALGSGRVLDEVLTLVIDSALDVTKAERGFIMMPDSSGELEFKNARGRGGLTLPGTSFTISSKIPREVFETGTSKIVGDLLDGDLASAHGGTIAIGIRHVLCVPLRVFARGGGNTTEVIGVLYLDGRERGTLLSSATMSSLEAFATQAALAIESARLYADSAEKAQHRPRPADRRRHPAGAAARRHLRAPRLRPGRRVGAVPDGRRRLLRLRGRERHRVRLRARRRGGQGSAGGAARGRGAEQLRRAGHGDARAGRDDAAPEPGAAAARRSTRGSRRCATASPRRRASSATATPARSRRS